MLPAAKNCVLRQLNISAFKKYRQGFSPYLHNPEHLGKQPERRYCLPSGFMAALRKKLEKGDGSAQYIQTHIGVGYRMLKAE